MSAEMQATAALVLLAIVALAVVLWLLGGRRRPLAPVTEWPPAPADRPTFAAELAAIDVPAGPNYSSGEWPLVARHAAGEDEPEVSAEPVEVEPEPEPQYPGPWWAQPVIPVYDERTPIFGESGSFPVLELDLSATNAWSSADRAALKAALRMDAEEAA